MCTSTPEDCVSGPVEFFLTFLFYYFLFHMFLRELDTSNDYPFRILASI